MRVRFPRLADGSRAYSIVEREDGVRYRLHEGVASAELPHDLTHFVVERATLDDGGFWAAIAAGAVFGSMEHLDGRRPPHTRRRSTAAIRERGSRLLRAELMAGLAEYVERRGITSHHAVEVAAKDALSALPDSSVDAEAVLAAAADLRRLRKDWVGLAVGEELLVSWPTGGGRRRRVAGRHPARER